MRYNMLEFILSAAGKSVYKALDNHDEWEFDTGKYQIKHNPTGVVLWIANGAWFFDVRVKKKSPFDDDVRILGIIERHIIWRKVKKLMDLKRIDMNQLVANQFNTK